MACAQPARENDCTRPVSASMVKETISSRCWIRWLRSNRVYISVALVVMVDPLPGPVPEVKGDVADHRTEDHRSQHLVEELHPEDQRRLGGGHRRTGRAIVPESGREA